MLELQPYTINEKNTTQTTNLKIVVDFVFNQEKESVEKNTSIVDYLIEMLNSNLSNILVNSSINKNNKGFEISTNVNIGSFNVTNSTDIGTLIEEYINNVYYSSIEIGKDYIRSYSISVNVNNSTLITNVI